jgi:hypothetical protein
MISLHFYIIYDIPTNRHTNTNETFRSEAGKGEVIREVCQIRAGGDEALRFCNCETGLDRGSWEQAIVRRGWTGVLGAEQL